MNTSNLGHLCARLCAMAGSAAASLVVPLAVSALVSGSALALASVAVSALASGCGDDDEGGVNHVENPTPAEGGGVSGGAVKGELNVFVVDSLTGDPISGAAVRVGEPEESAPIEGDTGASGLVIFTEASLAGAQVIHASAAGHAPATWFGANGAVVTLALAPTGTPAAPDIATVSGTIEGWDAVPVPVTNHIIVGLVLYSFTRNLDAPENQIDQPASLPGALPPNACVRLPAPVPSPACAWTLVTRTGTQTHYAIILDIDGKGTEVDTDDTFEVIGFAAKSGLELIADQTVTNESLEQIAAGDIADLTVTFPASAPTGLGELAALPILYLGDERLLFVFPGLSPDNARTKLPKATGELAGGSWNLFAQAKVTGDADDPSTTTFLHDIDPDSTVTLPAFLPLPTSLAAASGVFSFAAVAGASVYSAEVTEPSGAAGVDGTPAWSVLVLDDRREFSVPTGTPGRPNSQLPSGPLSFTVVALDLDGFDPGSFAIGNLTDSVNQLASQVIDFTN